MVRLAQRCIAKTEVEEAIRAGHGGREINRGPADWRLRAEAFDGRIFVVIYDCPVAGDRYAVRVVSAWVLRRNSDRLQGYPDLP